MRRRGLERSTFVKDGAPADDEAAAGTPSPERAVAARMRTEQLAGALETLPEGQREALVLFHIEGSSYEDIARTLDVPMGTVMTWLHRGRRRLASLLEEPRQGAKRQSSSARKEGRR
jgi:RNA polymerase sigma-70 factor (ECF subfamily)